MRPVRPSPRLTASVVALALLALPALGGCSIMDNIRPGSKASTQKASAKADEIDVRRYLGPDYCPELRIYAGADLIRTYQRGHQGDQDFVVWQSSFGKTARECLFDTQGNLTLRIGISGRLVSGPKGDGDSVTIPIRIAIVKYKESVLATERFELAATIPARGSTVFTEVKEITVPSPGRSRDYLIYVGFDVGDWDPMVAPGSGAAIAAAEEPPIEEEPPLAAAAPPPKKPPQTPNELPVPTGGFVLSQ